MLEKIKVVLSHTTHPGNIGAAARAMKVMGLSKLRLINPSHFPSAEAMERASKASDVLSNAQAYQSLEDSIADCKLVVGTSARTRSLPSKLVTPSGLVEVIKANTQNLPVAILFGTENSGLTNEELHRCHYHVYIPTNPEYSSLNLASAVQLISYEMRLAFSDMQQLPEQRVIANESMISQQQMQGLLEHLEKTMRMTNYLNPAHPKQIDQRLNRLFAKAQVTESEYRLLRGFLSSIESSIEP